MTEEMRWYGDGFDAGHQQIGRRVDVNGKTGVVVDGSEMFITVKWDRWWIRLWKWIFVRWSN